MLFGIKAMSLSRVFFLQSGMAFGPALLPFECSA
jgi:hypothetical protein